MKNFIFGMMLAMTAVSGVVVASQAAGAFTTGGPICTKPPCPYGR
jgi:hypothetical protein